MEDNPLIEVEAWSLACEEYKSNTLKKQNGWSNLTNLLQLVTRNWIKFFNLISHVYPKQFII